MFIGLVVSALALFLAVRGVDGRELLEAFSKVKLLYAIPLVLFLFLFYYLKLLRWQLLLSAASTKPSRGDLAGPMVIGFAANNLLPFRIGELIRLLLAAKETQISKTTVLGSLIIERFFDISAILLLGALALTQIGKSSDSLPFQAYFTHVALACMMAILLISIFSHKIVSFLTYVLRILPVRWHSYLVARVQAFEKAFTPIRSPLQALILILNSILQWALLGAGIWVACIAAGCEIPVLGALYVLVLTVIGISIPSTPGFIGVIEYCFVLGLSAFGIEKEQALAAAVFYHVITWVGITSVGTFFVHRYALSWKSIANTES